MKTDNKLLEMLTGYASAHQHPFNVLVHLLGIPMIMLGVLIPMTWASISVAGITITLAHVTVLGFFLFYLTLDRLFAAVFLVAAIGLIVMASWIAQLPLATALTVSAVCFFGGYAAQFIGHAVERSMPVLVRHPIQANLAAPFFTIVELFKIAGLREELFDAVQKELASRRDAKRASGI